MHNRFQVLQDIGSNVEEQWRTLRQAMTELAEECISRIRGPQKESWIEERTWKITDKRESVKYRMQQAKALSEKEETKNEYSDLNRQVKRNCRADKNEWLGKKGKRMKKQQAKMMQKHCTEL